MNVSPPACAEALPDSAPLHQSRLPGLEGPLEIAIVNATARSKQEELQDNMSVGTKASAVIHEHVLTSRYRPSSVRSAICVASASKSMATSFT